MNIQDAKFKKKFAGEYKIEGTYQGMEVSITASRRDSGDFSWTSYVSGMYNDGDQGITLGYLKQLVNRAPECFFSL